MHLRHPVEDTSTLYLIEFRYYFILLTFLCVYVSLLMHAHTYTQMRQTRTRNTITHNTSCLTCGQNSAQPASQAGCVMCDCVSCDCVLCDCVLCDCYNHTTHI